MLVFFFFNDTATTEIYTLSLHDALPISRTTYPLFEEPFHGTPAFEVHGGRHDGFDFVLQVIGGKRAVGVLGHQSLQEGDRKSTRLNSSHGYISYAVFCLKKKKTTETSNE